MLDTLQSAQQLCQLACNWTLGASMALGSIPMPTRWLAKSQGPKG